MYFAWLRTTERLESIAVRERLQSAKVDVAGADWNGGLEPGGLNVERVRVLPRGERLSPSRRPYLHETLFGSRGVPPLRT